MLPQPDMATRPTETAAVTDPGDASSSASPTLEPHDLFHYLPTYRVLICTRCCYAIQPSAIRRHLKDIHQIFRARRRPFLDFVRGLVLDEPAHVAAPAPQDFPIPYLPVENGWRCKAAGCDYKCASIKRMEMHWPATHGGKGRVDDDFTSVPLQTWFRGNMLRYFCGPSAGGATADMPFRTAGQPVPAQPMFPPPAVEQQPVLEERNVSTTHPVLVLRRLVIANYNVDDLGAEILDYFFARTYYTVLVGTDVRHPALAPWLGLVPALALRFRFIFDGLMALGYMQKSHYDRRRRTQLIVRAAAHQDRAIPAFRRALEAPSRDNCHAILVYGYMLLILSIASDDGIEPYEPCFTVRDGRVHFSVWFHCLRSAAAMVGGIWALVEAPYAGILAPAERPELIYDEVEGSRVLAWPRLSDLLAITPSDGSWSDAQRHVYATQAAALVHTFRRVELLRRNPAATGVEVLTTTMAWILSLPDDALELLSLRHPTMVVLLVHWVVLMHALDQFWFLDSRAGRGFEFAHHALDESWYPSFRRVEEIIKGGGLWDAEAMRSPESTG